MEKLQKKQANLQKEQGIKQGNAVCREHIRVARYNPVRIYDGKSLY